MTKRLLAALIIASFISVAIFGFMAIGTKICIATMSTGGVCRAFINTFEAVFFHLSTFKSFSAGIIQLLIGLAFLFLIMTIAAVNLNQSAGLKIAAFTLYQKQTNKIILPLRQILRYWLILKQTSTPASLF